jgi:formylglycine-generating enzyme required for sulfatase activity
VIYNRRFFVYSEHEYPMTDTDPRSLHDQLAAIERALRELHGHGPEVRVPLEANAAALRQRLEGQPVLPGPAPDRPAPLEANAAALRQQLADQATLPDPPSKQPDPTVQGQAILTGGHATIMVGVNTGTINYAGDSTTDDQHLIRTYLQSLANRLQQPPIRELAVDLPNVTSPLTLPTAYVPLATTTHRIVAQGPADAAIAYFEHNDPRRDLLPMYHPDTALPDTAIVRVLRDGRQTHRGIGAPAPQLVTLERAVLVTDAMAQHPNLILLGGPGSGKSTMLRHYAWSLARQVLESQNDDPRALPARIPVLLPATQLAQYVQMNPQDSRPVRTMLQTVVQANDAVFRDALLVQLLQNGAICVLLDGLDEVPVSTTVIASRAAVAGALASFAHAYPLVQVVMTCRERAFEGDRSTLQHWPTVLLAPWTLGQIRHAVTAWYQNLEQDGFLAAGQADLLVTTLLQTLTDQAPLRSLAQSPLLLMMMALVLVQDGMLPRDRPQLYERVITLLLGQWDRARNHPDLAQVLDLPGWTSANLRPLIDQLAFTAHETVAATDGRAILARSTVRDAVIEFFRQAGVPDAWSRAERTLDYLDQRSGLLVPDGAADYTFAHLTFQEYAAGCHLVRAMKPVTDVLLQRRHDDRWREPILLGLGAVMVENPSLVNDILLRLLHPTEHGQRKNRKRRYRDLILAGDIAEDRTWEHLRASGMDGARIQDALRAGLVDLLEDTKQPLPVSERARAGFVLGHIDDPRYPVTLAAWKKAVKQTLRGYRHPYFCRVDAGEYWIGSDDGDPDAQPWERPRTKIFLASPFWISRFLITNDQWQAWPHYTDWRHATDENADQSHPNQAVGSVSWNDIMSWCTWLSAEVGGTITLPTVLEWEMAARGPQGLIYPWGNQWKTDHAALGVADVARRRSAYEPPVGCYPNGRSPCGAMDMAGSMWEWTGTLLPYDRLQRRIPAKWLFMMSALHPPSSSDALQCCVIKGAAPPFLESCGRSAFSTYWDYQTFLSSSDRGFRIVLRATG